MKRPEAKPLTDAQWNHYIWAVFGVLSVEGTIDVSRLADVKAARKQYEAGYPNAGFGLMARARKSWFTEARA